MEKKVENLDFSDFLTKKRRAAGRTPGRERDNRTSRGPASAAVPFPVFRRREAGCPAEYLAEIVAAGKAAGDGDLVDGKGGVQQKEEGMGQADPVEAGQGRLSGFPGKKPSEIGRGEAETSG